MKIVAGIVSALVLSNLALAVVILQRQQESDDRLARVEKSADRGEKAVAKIGERLDASERRIEQFGDDLQRVASRPAAPLLLRPATAPAQAAPSFAPGTPDGQPAVSPLSDAQRDAVKKEVEEAVTKKFGHMPDMEAMRDPLGTMEKELGLNAYQKERIKGHLDQMDADSIKFVMESVDLKDPDKFDFTKLGDFMAIRKKCDDQIAGELDSTQQAKYADLKKSGKLPGLGGSTMRFSVGSAPPDPNR